MASSYSYFFDGTNKQVDHKTVETMSRELSKIITEQIRQNIPQKTKQEQTAQPNSKK